MYSINMRFQKATYIIAASIIFIFAIEEIAGDSPSMTSSLLRRQYQSNYDNNERRESISVSKEQSIVGDNNRSLLRRRQHQDNNNNNQQPQTHQHRSLADHAADFFRQHFGNNIKKIKFPSSLPRPTTPDDIMNPYNNDVGVPTRKPTPILTAKPTRKDIGGIIRPWPLLGPTKPITTNDDVNGAGGDDNDNEETTTTTTTTTSTSAAAATPKPTTTQPIPTPSPTTKQIITNNTTPSPTSTSSSSSPTTTTTKDDHYFPRSNIDTTISCVYGNDYPDWYENDGMLFDSMMECEDEYVTTTTTTSSTTTSTSSTSTTPLTNSPTSKPESKPKQCYPILGSDMCQCDTNYPDFMMLDDTNTNEYFLSKDICDCCSKHSCDGMNMDELGLSCPELVTTTTTTSTGTTSSTTTSSSTASTTTSTTTSSSSTTTSSSANMNEDNNNDDPTSYWYPGKDDTGTKTCIYDTLYPSSYLTMINPTVLFVSEEECCTNFPCRVPVSKVSYWYPVTIQQEPQQDDNEDIATEDGDNWVDKCVYNNEWPDSYNNEMIMPPLLYEVESECLNYLDGIR